MGKHRLTLQQTLALSILLTGLIGVALVFITSHTYRQLAFEQQKNSINHLIAIKSSDLIDKLFHRQKDLGFRLQGEAEFKKAFNNNNKQALINWIDQEFNRFFVTLGQIKLEKIIVYDKNFQLVAISNNGIDINNEKNLPCSQTITQVKSLAATQRTKPTSQLCEYNNHSLSTSVVSIGSLNARGYIQIIASPASMLTEIETELDLPLRIFDRRNVLLHQSANWPAGESTQNNLISFYTLTDNNNNAFLNIYGASDINAFRKQMNDTRFEVMLSASTLTLLTVLIALFILQRGLFPLKKLRNAADSCAQGRFVSVKDNAFSEISAPIHAFNLMLNKIQALLGDLRNEVIEHQKTETKLKQAKIKAERHAKNAKKQSKFLHMTLQSIVDGVITTDTDGKVKSMNPMAVQLTGWTADEANNTALTQVMHALQEDSLKRIDNLIENIEIKSVIDEPVNAILVQNNSNIETPIEFVVAPMRNHDDNIVGIVVIIHDVSLQRSLNRQLTFQATHDALTGLINRYEFERRLKNTLSLQAKTQTISSLCFIDLDQFKLVNDTCGHAAGDQLLNEITLLLQDNLEGIGTLARIGGDEFGLLLEDCNTINAEKIASNILEVLQQYEFSWQENSFTISASIGIAAISSADKSYQEILRNADSACYLAKDSGRNCVQIFTEEDDQLLTQQREMHWVSRINHALQENRFQLYFQEIIPLAGHKQSFLLHGEILLRMMNKDGEIVSPNNFLPAAERYNMITHIDEWVINKSIQWLAGRSDKVLISVNLSGISLSNKDFLNYIVTKIKQHDINPELLCFEITETAAIGNLASAIHFMNVLKKLGCTFALDDFGSGLSSFSYLNELPVDYLKIDGAFVKDIDKDPMHYAMVKSINEIGQVMGISTIAEYASSDSIIECLRKIGVDNAQGYAISRPLPLSSVSVKKLKPSLTTAIEGDQ